MSNNSNKNRSNLLKGIGTLCLFIFVGYYAYQDSMDRNMLERSLNENAVRRQRHSRNQSVRPQPSPATHEDAAQKNAPGKMQHAATESMNDYDAFHEHLDEFLSDPEDEQTYPPEIFDFQMDEDEDEYDRPDFEY